MDRRKFIGAGLSGLCSVILPATNGFTQNESAEKLKSKVWMIEGNPFDSAQKLIEAIGGLKQWIPDNGVVLLKPNIGFPTPAYLGATTDPEFLGAVIESCIEARAKRVIVIDHPVGSSAESNLERSGIGEVCGKYDKVQVLMADQERFYQNVDVPSGRVLKNTSIAKILNKVDLFINIPTAKHHSATKVSLGLKNLMGMIWNRIPFHQEFDLDVGIADLATLIKPQLTLLEAHYALLTNGPTGPGQVEEVNKYLAGFDPVAVDSIGTELAAYEGRLQKGINIPHLRIAQEFRVGNAKREDIELVDIT
jgi:uncharacterized protein (DUF362 family)